MAIETQTYCSTNESAAVPKVIKSNPPFSIIRLSNCVLPNLNKFLKRRQNQTHQSYRLTRNDLKVEIPPAYLEGILTYADKMIYTFIIPFLRQIATVVRPVKEPLRATYI